MLNLAVFVGSRGRGSNLMAIQTAIEERRLDARIVAVVGSQSDAPALARARDAGLPVVVVSPKKWGEGYDAALVKKLGEVGADTIALAGYMRMLPASVVQTFRHRILNTHPALLPAFGGKGMYGHHVHEAVLAYGAKVSGCSVHFVDEQYDTGPVIVQKTVSVLGEDTPESLAARILPIEHEAYVEALKLLAEGRLTVEGRRVSVSPRR